MKNPVIFSKIESVALVLFLTCMVLTATIFLIGTWSGTQSEILPKIMATFFVIGFASFLTWLPIVLYRLIGKLPR